MYNSRSYLQDVDQAAILASEPECIFVEEQAPCDADFAELCEMLVNENDLHQLFNDDPYDRLNLYEILRDIINVETA